MEATWTPRTGSADAADTAPACPRCRSGMVLHAERRDARPAHLFWLCSRSPACHGTRKVEAPQALRPTANDASVQAVYEWERARERGGDQGHGMARVAAAVGAVLPRRGSAAQRSPAGRFGGTGYARARAADPRAAGAQPARARPTGRLLGLIEHGFVVLEDRRLSFARVRIDNVAIGPTGIFVIEFKPWPGQLAVADDELYVDGRARTAATEGIQRARTAVEGALAHELKPVGVPVLAVLCFEHASPAWFKSAVKGVTITNGRALGRAIREGQHILGPETVVRLALAADRLLE